MRTASRVLGWLLIWGSLASFLWFLLRSAWNGFDGRPLVDAVGSVFARFAMTWLPALLGGLFVWMGTRRASPRES
jgi:hypothetical protein